MVRLSKLTASTVFYMLGRPRNWSALAIAFTSLISWNATTALAAGKADGLKAGKVELQSGGPICFGPDGLLFIGDPKAAKVHAVGTGDNQTGPAEAVNIDNVTETLAGKLGVKAKDVRINDMTVNPASRKVYLSVSRLNASNEIPVIFAITKGELNEVALDNIPNASVELGNPVAAGSKQRQETITGIKFVKDKIYIAGLSNEEFASTLRTAPYPFDGKVASSGIEIYHGAHGQYETKAPVRTFTAYEINGRDEILAAYTCTPLVRIPVSELKNGKVKGTTVAELGNRNKPLDIITYTKDSKPYALIANSARGVMKVSLDEIEKVNAIVERISDKAGLTYETIADLKGVDQLDKLDDTHAVLLVRTPEKVSIKTIDLP